MRARRRYSGGDDRKQQQPSLEGGVSGGGGLLGKGPVQLLVASGGDSTNTGSVGGSGSALPGSPGLKRRVVGGGLNAKKGKMSAGSWLSSFLSLLFGGGGGGGSSRRHQQRRHKSNSNHYTWSSMTTARRQQLLLRIVAGSLCGSLLLWLMSSTGIARQQQQQQPRTKKHLDVDAGNYRHGASRRKQPNAYRDEPGGSKRGVQQAGRALDADRILPRLVYYGYRGDGIDDNSKSRLRTTLGRNSTGTTKTARERTKRKNGSSRKIRYPIVDEDYWVYLRKSKDFRRTQAESMYTEDCEPQYDWQVDVKPTCNLVHEFADLTKLSYPSPPPPARRGNNITKTNQREWGRLIANGFWRDVFVVYEEVSDQYRVTKSLRYNHELTGRNYDRNRRDAMALERLTASRLVVNIFGYCSATGVFEYSDGGDIYRALFPPDDGGEKQNSQEGKGKTESEEEDKKKRLSPLEKLQIATQSAMALAEVHNIDKEGQASIAHTDISPDQFILIDGFYRINDFNRARFISKNRTTGVNCPYFVGKNPGKFRSPEEYRYDPQSEKVDVYSFGNIIYTLMMEETPFTDVKSSKKVAQLVAKGKRPSVYSDVWNSTDPIVQSLKEAMIMCHVYDPNERATARQVEHFLKGKLEQFDPGKLKTWGFDPNKKN